MSTTNSGSSSSSSRNSIQRKLCHHGVEADLLTSGTSVNPFRRYYHCRLRYVRKIDLFPLYKLNSFQFLITCCFQSNVNDCGYFEWMEPGMHPYQKECIRRLMTDYDLLQAENDRLQGMERLTVEQLSVKDEQIQELQKLNVVVDDLVDELSARKVELEINEHKLMMKMKLLERRLEITYAIISILVVILGACTAFLDE
ncbi:hypothetical protein OROMI_006004 [Orobanche minor]